AQQALTALGFAGGGPERNYEQTGLPADAGALAKLMVRAFDAAYARRGPDLAVKTNSTHLEQWLRERGLWVGALPQPPMLEPLTYDLVRAALTLNGWRTFRDEAAGALMTWWGWSEQLRQTVHVDYRISGEPPTRILTIRGLGGVP